MWKGLLQMMGTALKCVRKGCCTSSVEEGQSLFQKGCCLAPWGSDCIIQEGRVLKEGIISLSYFHSLLREHALTCHKDSIPTQGIIWALACHSSLSAAWELFQIYFPSIIVHLAPRTTIICLWHQLPTICYCYLPAAIAFLPPDPSGSCSIP